MENRLTKAPKGRHVYSTSFAPAERYVYRKAMRPIFALQRSAMCMERLTIVNFRINGTRQTGAVRKMKRPFFCLVGAVSNCADAVPFFCLVGTVSNCADAVRLHEI